MNNETMEDGKVVRRPTKRFLKTRILMASLVILSGITGAGITAAFLMAKADKHDHDSCREKLPPHFLGHLTVNEETAAPEHGTIQGEAVEQLHALVTTSNGTIASGRKFDASVKLHVPNENASTNNHTSRRLSEDVNEVKLHVETATLKVRPPANNSLPEPAGDVLSTTMAEWTKDSVIPYLTILETEGASTVEVMICARDKCVFAGEGHRHVQDDKIHPRRELTSRPREQWSCGACYYMTRWGDNATTYEIMFTLWVIQNVLPKLGAMGIQVVIPWESPVVAVVIIAALVPPVVSILGRTAEAVTDAAPAVSRGVTRAASAVSGGVTKAASAVSGGCLPGDALVQQLINGQPTLKPIASVPHGAHVLTSGGFSPIYLFSHQDNTTMAVMRHIETESGQAIQLTPQHYIQADGQYKSAEKVDYGMQVPIRFLNGTLSMSEVRAVHDVQKQGLFNPMTMRGDVVVFSAGNSAAGIVVSDQSEWWAEGYLPESIIPSLYRTVLSPVRLLHSIAPAWTGRFQAYTSNLLLSVPGSPSLDHLGFSGLVMAALYTSYPSMSMNSGTCSK